jgi:hypothetical protein
VRDKNTCRILCDNRECPNTCPAPTDKAPYDWVTISRHMEEYHFCFKCGIDVIDFLHHFDLKGQV